MKRSIIALVLGFALVGVAGAADPPQTAPTVIAAVQCSMYFPQSASCANPGSPGQINSWSWRSSPSTGRRNSHTVYLYPGPCLPAYARWHVRYRSSSGAVLGNWYSPNGACGYQFNVTSGGQYAYADCKIDSNQGGVARTVWCGTYWY